MRKQTGGFVFALSVSAASCKFGRKRGYLTPDLVARNAQIIGRLQIEPELRAGLKPVSETKGGVAGDRTLALNDLRNAIWWYGNLPRQLSRRDLEFVQLVGKDFAGMNAGRGIGFFQLWDVHDGRCTSKVQLGRFMPGGGHFPRPKSLW